MALQDPEALILAGVATLAVITLIRWRINPLRSIPTVGGSSASGLSILTARKFMRHGLKKLFDEGYQRYYGSPFKVALLDQWLVIVSGPKLVDELIKRPDNELSAPEGMAELVQLRYIAGHEILDDRYQIDVIKNKLTRTLPVIFPDVVDEVKRGVSDCILTKGDEWTAINVMTTMEKLIVRASNRVFVGLPLCRNEEYLALCIRMTMDVVHDWTTISAYPYFLKPLAAHFLGKTKETIGQGMRYIQPMINARRATMRELGDDWSDKPNDVLQWIMEEALPRKSTDYTIAEHILHLNMAAIHSSSITITQSLYDVTSMPECIPELREEIESVIATDGWTKAAIGKMWKLDSVFRETLRYHGLSITGLVRKAMKDITLNDGTFIPKGTLLTASLHSTHHDESKYANPELLDPFRFATMRGSSEGETLKHQFVNTSADYIPFGHGRHACPGRFFAANEVKMALAYIILNYDLRIGGDGKRHADVFHGTSVIPPVQPVFFRKRQAVSES
ncbi:cytochrome P450 [Ganoderma leucocontextum]|nr:cytochrome P450 [Ganoderma leucocontextum]